MMSDVDYEKELVRHSDTDVPVKPLEQFVHPKEHALQDTIKVEENESALIGGVPEEHIIRRRARIFKPAKEATQSGWANTRLWKIELDNRERWENPLMGWSSNSDPLSNISMTMKFASKDDAIRFCEKNRWEYEIIEPQTRKLTHKTYAMNFAWDKRTRTGMK